MGDCAICLESLDAPGLGRKTLPCGHALHENCAFQMRRKGAKASCPLCRAECPELASVEVLFKKAVTLEVRKSFTEAFCLYLEILDVDPENVAATSNLGVMYSEGRGVAQDFQKALELYHAAHDAGNRCATFNLGVMYEQGRGVAQDFQKALELYHAAHDAGHRSA